MDVAVWQLARRGGDGYDQPGHICCTVGGEVCVRIAARMHAPRLSTKQGGRQAHCGCASKTGWEPAACCTLTATACASPAQRQRRRRWLTGGGQALDGIDVSGAHELEGGRILDVGQGGDDVERGAGALRVASISGKPAGESNQRGGGGGGGRRQGFGARVRKAGTLPSLHFGLTLRRTKTPERRGCAASGSEVLLHLLGSD